MTEPLLQMRNITKNFSAVVALENVNIDLFEGEILAICGENGAGKSTLMKILSGSYPQGTYTGQIVLNGEDVQFQSTRDAERYGIEMIYQEISLHLDLSVAENILLGNLPLNKYNFIDWKKGYRLADEALNLVKLDVSAQEKVRKLSTSQQQLISIARACLKKPRILVLDEPTSALTETEAENLFSILDVLRSNGISCIYISHKLEEIMKIADRIIVLRDGHYISTRNTESVSTAQIIEDMVGRKLETLFPKETAEVRNTVLRVENFNIPHPQNPKKYILENVSFRVKRGEVVGLAGLVGSGRSELLDSIFGIHKEGFSGKLYIEEKEVVIDSSRKAKEFGIGYVTEDRKKSGYVGTMNVAKNITLANLTSLLRGLFMSMKRETEIAREYMKRLDIRAPSEKASILNLSGGNQQKTVLAKWLNRNPKIFLLDEPTRGIDVGAKVEIYKLISDLAKEGVGILLVTSEMPELIAMCDRFLVLSNGAIQAELTKADVSQQKIMEAATSSVR